MMYVIAQRSDEESNDWRLYATASSHKDAERIWARARKDGLTVRIMTPAQLDEKTGDEATLLADDGELFVQKTFAEQAEAEVALMYKQRAARAEAEVALRDRMLRLAFDDMPDDGLTYSDVDYEMWLDGLRARAEEGEET